MDTNSRSPSYWPIKIIQYLLRITKSHSGTISIGIIDKKYEKIRSC